MIKDNIQKREYKIFYCYSYRMYLFLSSLNFECIEKGRNLSTLKKYWAFKNINEEQFNKAINYWNELKIIFNN